MFSQLRKGLLYTDTDPNIVEHDEDIDASEWSYDGRSVYRGRIDPRYESQSLDVYWLYDNDINKVGLVEYEKEDAERFKLLWFYDNPFATLFQSSKWTSLDKTIWSLLPYEAYLDCLEDDFKTVLDRCLTSKYRLITPSLLKNPPVLYSCKNCKKNSIKALSCCEKYIEKKNYFQYDSFLFVDESFIVHELTTDQQSSASSEQEPKPEAQEQVPRALKPE
jgi:hypothetical protein